MTPGEENEALRKTLALLETNQRIGASDDHERIVVLTEQGLLAMTDLREFSLVVREAQRRTLVLERAASNAAHDGVTLPLVHEGQTVGWLTLPNESKRESQESAVSIATQACRALAVARRMHCFEDLIYHDDTTHLFNARYLKRTLGKSIAAARRYGTPLSVLFIDLDRFKQVNDTHGHDVGSEVLREFSSMLRLCLRVADVPARYGGDEFVVILPETSTSEAVSIAARVGAMLATKPLVAPDGASVHLTASFGIATYPAHGSDGRSLLRQADLAMYRSKQAGRDRITVAVNAPKNP